MEALGPVLSEHGVDSAMAVLRAFCSKGAWGGEGRAQGGGGVLHLKKSAVCVCVYVCVCVCVCVCARMPGCSVWWRLFVCLRVHTDCMFDTLSVCVCAELCLVNIPCFFFCCFLR